MPKITVEELMSMMANPETPPDKLKDYFVLDEEASGPFDPRLKLNPETVQIPKGPNAGARTAQAMNGANWLSRMHRRGRYNDRIRSGYDGPRIVSEGDSWWQYPVFLKDTIDHLMDDYAVYSLGAAGDLLKNMADKAEYMSALADTDASILLLSGGGNDLVAGGHLAVHLEDYDPALTRPGDYLLPSFQQLLDSAISQYERMFRQVRGAFPHVRILCHGYDYPLPKNGKWLGKPMRSRGINDPALQKAIAAEMMDRFNRDLRRLARTMPHVDYIDCRNRVGSNRWHDELHPTNSGYGTVASLFKSRIQQLANTQPRSFGTSVIGGPFGRAQDLRKAIPAAASCDEGPASQSMSLHIGLNRVDPAHYAGWDGALKACVNDAEAMQRLARSQGFTSSILLDEDATRSAVVAEITRAAETLKAGDMFMMSVSSHGGQLPDFNGDEADDGELPMDETLCLYDFQIADDELLMLWNKFANGVRVLLVADTCHSGTMVRKVPDFLTGRLVDAGPDEPAVRSMPSHVAIQTARQNLADYQEVAESYSGINESTLLDPVTTTIGASVMGLSACKDHQFAMDGAKHGAFTGALLKVWDNGRYSGDYTSIRKEISDLINDPNQTPNLDTVLVRDPCFIGQVPFTLWTNPLCRHGTSAHGGRKAAPAMAGAGL